MVRVVSDDLLDAIAPRVCTTAMKRACLERELKLRRKVYPNRVANHRMSSAAAEREIWIIEKILEEGFSP